MAGPPIIMPQGDKKEKKSKKNDSEPPLTAVERLQALNLVSRIASEGNNHLGISDRTLAEFVIDLAERRIKSFLKEQFVKESGMLYRISLADGDLGESSKIRVGVVSTEIERHVDTISAFRDDLMTNGAGDSIPPTFAARILRIVCEMSPRMERLMRKMEEKKRSRKKKSELQDSRGGTGAAVMSAIAPAERKREMESQFPGLAGKNLMGSVPLEDGFYEHDKNKGEDLSNVHQRSRNKKRNWDDEGDENGKSKVETVDSGKRSKSNLPAWMTQNSNDEKISEVRETSARAKSNLPAWMTQKQQPSVEDIKLELYQIFRGSVQRVLDFGIVVDLILPGKSPDEKISGMVHLSHVSKSRIEKPKDAGFRPGQSVYVKLISIGQKGVSAGAGEGGLMLSLKDVDQKTGADLMPHRSLAAFGSMAGNNHSSNNNATGNAAASASAVVVHPGLDVAALKRRQDDEEAENITQRQMQGIKGMDNTYLPPSARSQINNHRSVVNEGGVRRAKQLTEHELFEAQQLIRSGVLPVEQYPTFDNEGGLGMLAQEVTEEQTEVELADFEPAFLRGQTRRSGRDLEPIRIVKNPDGSLQRAAMQQGTLAKERRELRQAQANQLVDSIPKDLNRPWEDPLPEAGERHFAQELRSINMSAFDGAPEWKQKAESKTLSYGIISNKSIKEQREGLPIYRLKPELMRAFSENQVLVVIGETGSGRLKVCR